MFELLSTLPKYLKKAAIISLCIRTLLIFIPPLFLHEIYKIVLPSSLLQHPSIEFFTKRVSSTIKQSHQNSAWVMLLSKPDFTLHHLREGLFFVQKQSLLSYSSYTNLHKAYYFGNSFRLSPTLLAIFQPFFVLNHWIVNAMIYTFANTLSYYYDTNTTIIKTNDSIENFFQEVFFGIFLSIIDFLIGYLLFDLAKRILCLSSLPFQQMSSKKLNNYSEEKDSPEAFILSEENIETEMHNYLKPDNGWLFGIPASSSYTQSEDEPILPISDIPHILFILHFCNPFGVLSSSTLILSFQNIPSLLYILSLREASRTSNGSFSTFCLALLTIVFKMPHSIMYLIPITILFTFHEKEKHVSQEQRYLKMSVGEFTKNGAHFLGFYAFYSMIFLCMSSLLLGGFSTGTNNNGDSTTIASLRNQILQTILPDFNYTNHTPNLSLIWYFYIQMFHRFRDYYIMLFNGVPYIFLIPMSIRLWRYPIEMVSMSLYHHSILFPLLHI